MATYFAYGTLLDYDEMRKFCTSAEPIGVMRLEGYRLGFVTCADGVNGGCTLDPAPEETLYGLQWEMPSADLAALDDAAGVSSGLWEHKAITVTDREGNLIETITFRIPDNAGPFAPSDGYVRPILAGARKLELPDAYITTLEEVITRAQAG